MSSSPRKTRADFDQVKLSDVLICPHRSLHCLGCMGFAPLYLPRDLLKDAPYCTVLVQPGSKEPQPMPEAAKEALKSSEEFNTSMPKRH